MADFGLRIAFASLGDEPFWVYRLSSNAMFPRRGFVVYPPYRKPKEDGGRLATDLGLG